MQHVRNLNAYDQLDLDIEVRGTLPQVPAGAKVEFKDNDIEYNHNAPGSITSRGRQTATVDGEEIDIELDQQVNFLGLMYTIWTSPEQCKSPNFRSNIPRSNAWPKLAKVHRNNRSTNYPA